MREKDEILVKRARKGDSAAFSELILAHEKRVYNLALRMTGNPDDALDAAQESFVKAYVSLKGFRGDSNFSTWLYRIASNVCLDHLRKRQKAKITSLDRPIVIEDSQMDRQIADPSDGPEDLVERREISDLVREGIESLQPEHRLVIILRDLQGFSYDEISRILNCSLGTVKSRLNRGRAALREKLRTSELFATSDVSRGERGVEGDVL